MIFITLKINAQEIRVIDKKGTIQTVNNNLVTTSTTFPSNPVEGDIWFDTTNSLIRIFDPSLPLPITNQWPTITSTGGLTNIYTTDGTLTSDRLVSGGTNNLRFTNLGRFDIDNVNYINLESTGFFDIRAISGINLRNSNTIVHENLSVVKSYIDSSGDVGLNGQVLSSTNIGTNWIDPNTVTVVNKTANYTLTIADNGKVFTFDSTIDITLTVPNGLPIGYNISIYQINTGEVTIQGGATILNRLSRFKTAGKDAGAGLISTDTNIFHLTGDLKL